MLNQAKEACEKIKDFLGVPLDTDAMAQQVDQSLYRQRKK